METNHLYHPNPKFTKRYLNPADLQLYLETNFTDSLRIVGESAEGRDIHMLSWGEGPNKIFAWSQMHGNESGSTLALLDLLYMDQADPSRFRDLRQKIQLDVIPQLNPDGALRWTRRNSLGLDINRDFVKESSPEIKILKKIVATQQYDVAFNLHEQRTIFSTDGQHPATLSFLAPSAEITRSLTPARETAMYLIGEVSKKMSPMLAHRVARYTDEFYPYSAGDNLMASGLPVLLFEGGHFEKDYYRKHTRKMYYYALLAALEAVADYKGERDTTLYEQLPENRESHYDFIFRNVSLKTDFPCVLDIAVQLREDYQPGKEEIDFVPYTVEVGDCSRKRGWQEFDCQGKYILCPTLYPKLEAVADFKIEGLDFTFAPQQKMQP